jgi:hypothetical protein
MPIGSCADAKEAVQPKAKTKASTMRIPWRTLMVWAIPLAAFAWLAIAGRTM